MNLGDIVTFIGPGGARLTGRVTGIWTDGNLTVERLDGPWFLRGQLVQVAKGRCELVTASGWRPGAKPWRASAEIE